MKKILFILLAILCHLDSFAQLGYWCNSKFIPLTPDESCDHRYYGVGTWSLFNQGYHRCRHSDRKGRREMIQIEG